MQLYFIVLNWNDASSTIKCVTSLVRQGATFDKVLIIDNASNDNSVEILQRQLPNVPLVRSNENLGFAGGMNLGARRILASCKSSDAIVFVNNDALALEDLRSLKSVLSIPKVGLVSPIIVNKHDLSAPAFQGSDYDWEKAEIIFYDANLATLRESNGKISSPRLSGAFLAARADLLEKIGLFDESFFMYYEDDDLSVRSTRAGYENVVSTSLKVAHTGKSSGDAPPHYFYYMKRNEIFFWRKYLSPSVSRWVILRLISEALFNFAERKGDDDRRSAIRDGVIASTLKRTGKWQPRSSENWISIIFAIAPLSARLFRYASKVMKKMDSYVGRRT